MLNLCWLRRINMSGSVRSEIIGVWPSLFSIGLWLKLSLLVHLNLIHLQRRYWIYDLLFRLSLLPFWSAFWIKPCFPIFHFLRSIYSLWVSRKWANIILGVLRNCWFWWTPRFIRALNRAPMPLPPKLMSGVPALFTWRVAIFGFLESIRIRVVGARRLGIDR